MTKKTILFAPLVILFLLECTKNKQPTWNYTARQNILKRFYLLDSSADRYLNDGNGDSIAKAISEEQINFSSNYSAELYMRSLLNNGLRWNYFTGNHPVSRLQTSRRYLLELLEIAKEQRNKSYECQALVALANTEKPYTGTDYFKYPDEAELIATLEDDDTLLVISKLAAGHILMLKHNEGEAYNKYFEATTISKHLSDSSFVRQCYIRFAELYNDIKMYQQGVSNVLLALKIDKKSANKYSVLEDYNWLQRLHSNCSYGGSELARRDLGMAIRFCTDPANKIYKAWTESFKIGLYESFVNDNQFHAADSLLKTDVDILNTIYAYNQKYRLFNETSKRFYISAEYDSAEKTAKSEIKYLKHSDPIIQLSANNNLDSILIKEGELNKSKLHEAMVSINKTEAYSTTNNLQDDQLPILFQKLSDRYAETENYRLAYNYLSKTIAINDSLNEAENKDVVVSSAIQKEKETLINARKSNENELRDEKTRLAVIVSFCALILLAIAAWMKVFNGRKRLIKLCIIISYLFTFELLSHLMNSFQPASITDNVYYEFIVNAILGIALGILHGKFEKWTLHKIEINDAANAGKALEI